MRKLFSLIVFKNSIWDMIFLKIAEHVIKNTFTAIKLLINNAKSVSTSDFSHPTYIWGGLVSAGFPGLACLMSVEWGEPLAVKGIRRSSPPCFCASWESRCCYRHRRAQKWGWAWWERSMPSELRRASGGGPAEAAWLYVNSSILG